MQDRLAPNVWAYGGNEHHDVHWYLNVEFGLTLKPGPLKELRLNESDGGLGWANPGEQHAMCLTDAWDNYFCSNSKSASPLMGFFPVLFGPYFHLVWRNMRCEQKKQLYDYAVMMQASRDMQEQLIAEFEDFQKRFTYRWERSTTEDWKVRQVLKVPPFFLKVFSQKLM